MKKAIILDDKDIDNALRILKSSGIKVNLNEPFNEFLYEKIKSCLSKCDFIEDENIKNKIVNMSSFSKNILSNILFDEIKLDSYIFDVDYLYSLINMFIEEALKETDLYIKDI